MGRDVSALTVVVLHKRKGGLERKPDMLLSGTELLFQAIRLSLFFFLKKIMSLVKHFGLNAE